MAGPKGRACAVFHADEDSREGASETWETEYQRCERNPQANLDCIDCDTENPVMACNDCKTLYMWKPMDGCGEFRFFVPLTDGIVRQIPPTHIAH